MSIHFSFLFLLWMDASSVTRKLWVLLNGAAWQTWGLNCQSCALSFFWLLYASSAYVWILTGNRSLAFYMAGETNESPMPSHTYVHKYVHPLCTRYVLIGPILDST